MFEDKALADEAVIAVEKEIHHDVDPELLGKDGHGVVHEEDARHEMPNKV